MWRGPPPMDKILVRLGSTPSNLSVLSLVPLASEVSLLAGFNSSAAHIPLDRVQDSPIISTILTPRTPSRNFEWQWKILMVSIDILGYLQLDLTFPSRCDPQIRHPRGKGRLYRTPRPRCHGNRSGTIWGTLDCYCGDEEHHASLPSASV